MQVDGKKLKFFHFYMRLMDLFTNYVTFSSEIFIPFVGNGILGLGWGDVEGVGLGVGILKIGASTSLLEPLYTLAVLKIIYSKYKYNINQPNEHHYQPY